MDNDACDVDFQRVVLETMAWCSARARVADPARNLRSDDLKPRADLAFWYTGPLTDVRSGDWAELRNSPAWQVLRVFEQAATVAQRRQAVEHVALRRRQKLSALGWTPEVTLDHLPPGQFLLCDDPSTSLNESACWVSSAGFFDEGWDLPPWDTWIHYAPALDPILGQRAEWLSQVQGIEGGREQLLVWVPEILVEVVATGIAVSSTERFIWATEAPLDQPFVWALLDAGPLR
ncbi:hypothetical protein [Deinococcus sonorensis]|uniref:Uncharacterized protein n=2 Tax=Deinococcus sonorensis TaxID=309891 RepID=A0AAU7U6J2_9DEIO